jgi:hypothetical protein
MVQAPSHSLKFVRETSHISYISLLLLYDIKSIRSDRVNFKGILGIQCVKTTVERVLEISAPILVDGEEIPPSGRCSSALCSLEYDSIDTEPTGKAVPGSEM